MAVRLCCLVVGALLAALAEAGEEYPCPHSAVVIHAADAASLPEACAGAGDALGFLGAAGLCVGMAIEVHVVHALPPGLDAESAGCYVHPQRQVYVLAPAMLERPPPSAGTAPPLRFRSLVTHEVAHAVAASNFSVEHPTLKAHEYIAGVTTIATMPAPARARLLAAHPGSGFDSAAQISATLFLLAPGWFAAEAYRHYRKPGNGPAFLRRVLAGEVLAEPDEF